MSQNKTRVAGLDSSDSANYGAPNMGGTPDSSFYARTGNEPKRGTVISGLGGYEAPKGNPGPAQARPNDFAPTQINSNNSGKPVVGFLYSVSRTAFGEYWPIHIGQNTIGQAPGCDIVLPEGTVSSEHAVLVARKLKKPEKVIASLCDSRSTNGTMLNGESLGFNPVECSNGDIITVGDNYELVLILIDAATLGLQVSENFIPVEVSSPEPNVPNFDPNSTRPGFVPNGGGFNPPPFNPPSAGGTVGMDGQQMNGHGGTVGM